MSPAVVTLLILVSITLGVLAHWRIAMSRHDARLEQLDIRVHINGIRGKSTVTRLVAAVLREGGYVTVAKTTGSAARVIGPMGEEHPIARRGAATINEQVDVVAEHVVEGVEALVIECMAVRPLYQKYSQDFMVRSDITVITNVREDHQEEMGESLEQIADSLSATIPTNGVLITAEERPHLRERLRSNAEAVGATMIFADPTAVSDEDMQGFDYLQFKENVAIGLTIARLLGIPRTRAVHGMWKSVPDIGVVRLRTYDIRGCDVLWVPMFAANDRESVIATFHNLQAQFPPEATVIGLLNNRVDRGRRAELFARMVPEDLAPFLDHVVTIGAYEATVTRTMIGLGYPADRIHNLGDTVRPDLDQLLDAIALLVGEPQERGSSAGRSAVLIGLINIHTDQAELLLEHFAELRGDEDRDALDESRDPVRAPSGTARIHRAASRMVPRSHTADRAL